MNFLSIFFFGDNFGFPGYGYAIFFESGSKPDPEWVSQKGFFTMTLSNETVPLITLLDRGFPLRVGGPGVLEEPVCAGPCQQTPPQDEERVVSDSSLSQFVRAPANRHHPRMRKEW